MSDTAIIARDIHKKYELGAINTGTFQQDLRKWLAKQRGKSDPTAIIGEEERENEFWALKGITFEIAQGDSIGVIGKNGAGKSTLLKILSRVTSPTIGNVKIRGRIASLLEVGTGFHPDLTGRENIFMNGAVLGMNRHEIKRKLEEIISFSGVEKHIDTPVKRYSSGMYVRLAFAVAAHLEPEILIVDEVLAVGDAEFQRKCFGKMGEANSQGRTVIFVSHNMASMRRLCNTGIYLKKGVCVLQGSFNSVADQYDLDVQNDMASEWQSEKGIVRRIWLETKTPAGIAFGQPLDIKINLSCEASIHKPVFGIIIKDFNEVPVIGINNRHYYQDDFESILNDVTVSIQIPYLKLLPGGYKIDLFLGTGNTDITQIKDCLLFQVKETQINSGATALNYQLNKIYHDEVSWKIIKG